MIQKAKEARDRELTKMGWALSGFGLFSLGLSLVQYLFNLHLGGTFETPLALGALFLFLGIICLRFPRNT